MKFTCDRSSYVLQWLEYIWVYYFPNEWPSGRYAIFFRLQIFLWDFAASFWDLISVCKKTHQQCKKIRKNSYKFHVQVIFQLYGPLFKIKIHLLSTVLFSGFQWSPIVLKSTEQGLGKITGLAGRANATVFKTEPIFTGLRPGNYLNS